MPNDKQIITKGMGASPGVVSGIVKVAYTPQEALEKLDEPGKYILVVPNTDPDWTITMRKAKAIIATTGGVLSHAAIVSRELGIPCVVGAIDATQKLKDLMKVTVDGFKGVVYLEE